MITQTYYVRTGAKNAMFGLYCHRSSPVYQIEFYVCPLSADAETAAYKATLYFNAMKDRMSESEGFKVYFCANPDAESFKRRGKLSVADTRSVEMIESGVVPFGKHAGKMINDLEAGYMLWLADKAGTFDGVAMNALAMAAKGAALQLGHIAARQVARDERAAVDSLSAHVGVIGDRLDFSGEVVTAIAKKIPNTDIIEYYITKVRCGDNLVSYVGGKLLGELGAAIKFKATVTRHEEYKGVKATKVSRPKLT